MNNPFEKKPSNYFVATHYILRVCMPISSTDAEVIATIDKIMEETTKLLFDVSAKLEAEFDNVSIWLTLDS
jgi:hypothetical protein